MSMIDKEVDEFRVQCYYKGMFETVTKKTLQGKWSILFFYPADFTFVCPTELEDLANKYEAFKQAGCELYAVSCDSQFVHKAWHDSSKRVQRVMFPMLADTTHELARAFDVLMEDVGMAERGSFIINPDGHIVAYEVNGASVGRNADELFRKLQACQFVAAHSDEVCPAKWTPGAETLKPTLEMVGQL